MTATANTVYENGDTKTIGLPQRIHLEEIKAEAHQAQPGQALLTLLLAPFFILGWLVGKASRTFVLAVTYVGVSARTGWRQARNEPLNQPKIGDVQRENAMLRAELQRLGGSG